MPFDLRPCEPPAYQPTFDLTKQKFIPSRNIPTLRELVRAKQDERILPPRNQFVGRMEDSLMRWKPPGSSHKGTTMAVDGAHPYQLPTGKALDHPKGCDYGYTANSTYVVDSFVNWWKGSKPVESTNDNMNGANADEDVESNDRDDEFSLNYEPYNANCGESRVSSAKTPYAIIPPRTPKPTSLDNQRLDNTVYQLYYGRGIPPDYLSGRYCNFNSLQHQHHHQQQHHHYQYAQDPSRWLRNCFSFCAHI